MTLGCARCGDCCDPVLVSKDLVDEVITPWVDYWDNGGTEPLPAGADPTIRFIYDHMTQVDRADSPDQIAYQCDQFNPDTRLCMAHDDAPPMCKKLPLVRRRTRQRIPGIQNSQHAAPTPSTPNQASDAPTHAHSSHSW